MKLILPVYVISIGNFLLGAVALWLNMSVDKPITGPIVYTMIGLTGMFIASVLRSQHKRIEKLESFSVPG